jgi:hypothetical protein
MPKTVSFLLIAAVFAAVMQLSAPAGAQTAPDNLDETKPADTRKEPGAKVNGRFGNDAVLDGAAQQIREDTAGACDSITTAVEGGGSAAIVCNRGKEAYFMSRTAGGMDYVAPPAIVPANRPPGQ